MKRAQRTRVAIALFVMAGIYLLVVRQPAPEPVPDPSATPSVATASPAASPGAEQVAASPAAPVSSASPSAAAVPDSPVVVVGPSGASPSPSGEQTARREKGPRDLGASPGPGEPTGPTRHKVLHARREIPKNTRFFKTNLDRYLVERELEVFPGSEAFTEGTSSVLDLVVKDVIPAGDMLQRSKLKPASEGDRLSIELSDGKRAISVSMSMESGVAGFLSQGDHVDILHHVQEEGEDQTYVLLENIKVLTVTNAFKHKGGPVKSTTPPSGGGPPDPDTGGGQARDVVRAENLTQVVFEVTPQEAEFLIQAENAPGSLSLVMRGLEVSKDAHDVLPITDDFLYTGRRPDTEGTVTEVEVYRGSSFKKEVRTDKIERKKPKFEDDPEVYLDPDN